MTKRITTVFLIWIAVAATATAATTIPLDLSTGRPVVEVTIAGAQPLRMVLDTGAGGSVVDAGLAAELGLETVGRQRIGDPSGRGAHDVDRVALPDVRLGGVALGDLEAAPLAGELVVAGHAIDGPTIVLDGLHRGTQGNLGTGFLRRFVVTLDQANHLVRFAPHGNPALRSDDLPEHRRPAAPASRSAGFQPARTCSHPVPRSTKARNGLHSLPAGSWRYGSRRLAVTASRSAGAP